jgi:hypothetical protein
MAGKGSGDRCESRINLLVVLLTLRRRRFLHAVHLGVCDMPMLPVRWRRLRCGRDALGECETEAGVQLAAAGAGESEDAAVELLCDPTLFQSHMKDGCAERTA